MKAARNCTSMTAKILDYRKNGRKISYMVPIIYAQVTMIFTKTVTFHMSHRMTKPTKCPVRSAKTQISLGIHPD